MEISGQRLSIPRNFFFLNRLPARFEILVVAKGAPLAKDTAFELEIQGQRLVINSKIDLKVGARYELEKISALEFKIVGEKAEEQKAAAAASLPPEKILKNDTGEEALGFFMPESRAAYTDLLALKVLADSGRDILQKSDKYLFNLASEFAVSGVFVPKAAGKYTLFLSGSGAHPGAIQEFGDMLAGFGVQNIRYVSAAVLERISAGAVDLQS
jgi:hypothetical protein